jgi:hypothetical protein
MAECHLTSTPVDTPSYPRPTGIYCQRGTHLSTGAWRELSST